MWMDLLKRRSARPGVAMIAHRAAVPPLSDIGEVGAYRRSYEWTGDFIDPAHRAIASLPVEGGLIRGTTQGFLRPADALALYELAYFSDGDVLEIGSAWGLSTTILCEAVRNAGRGGQVWSIEIDEHFQRATRAAVAELGLRRHYRLLAGAAGAVADRLIRERRRFGFAFIDHDHTYASTRRVCGQLDALLNPGGLVLFHDFIDVRNRTEPAAYGVHPAVTELASGPRFEFLGVIGCCALLRSRPE
jgi:predicted O-methyltransferase YrrM